jgi:hypothetical protein
LVFFDDHLVSLCGNRSLNSFAHQKAGDQPLEQALFVWVIEAYLQITGADNHSIHQ